MKKIVIAILLGIVASVVLTAPAEAKTLYGQIRNAAGSAPAIGQLNFVAHIGSDTDNYIITEKMADTYYVDGGYWTIMTENFANETLSGTVPFSIKFDVAGNSAFSQQNIDMGNSSPADFGLVTANTTNPLAAPVITVTPGDGKNTISWNPVGGATGYRLYRHTINNGYYQRVSASATSPYNDTGLVNGQAYYYVLVASTVSNTSPHSAVVSGTPQQGEVTNVPPVLAPIGNKSVQVNNLLTFTVSATDADGEALTYSASGLPAGANFNTDTRTFSWTPAAPGSHNVTFKVIDGQGGEVSETIVIAVTEIPNNPPVAGDRWTEIDEDTSLVNYDLVVNNGVSDPDGDPLTFTMEGAPSHGVATITADGKLNYTPELNWRSADPSDIDLIEFRVTDPGGLSHIGQLEIHVKPVNDAPMLQPLTSQTLTVGETVNIQLDATDVDGDILTYSVIGAPSGTQLNATGLFSWTPVAGQVGTYNLTFKVSDGQLEAEAAMTITVNAADLLTITVAPANTTVWRGANQTFVATGTYSDNSTSDITTQAEWQSSNPSVATVVNGVASALGVGSANITARIGEISGAALLTVDNRPPVANSQSVVTNEDTPVAITLTASDPDGDTLTYTIVNTPSLGGLSGAAPNLTYTPDEHEHGVDSFTFRVNDGVENSGLATVTITVNPVYDAPVLDPVPNKTAYSGEELTFNLTASDVDGGALTYSATNLPAGAGLNSATGAFSWTPLVDNSQVGPHTVTFTVTDPDGLSDSKIATITVAKVNRPPVANSQSVVTNEDAPVAITLTGSDPDNDLLTYTIVNTPSLGGLSGVAPNLTYTPYEHDYGTYSFTFRVDDGIENSDLATVTITVNPVNDAPVLAAIVAPQTVKVGETVSFKLSATDVDGDQLTYSVSGAPADSLNALTGQFSWVPTEAGTAVLTFAVSDGTISATQTVTITVLPATLEQIKINPVAPSLPLGNALQFEAIGTFSDDSTEDLTDQVSWSSSAAAIAWVDQNGLATSVAVGTTNITATYGQVSGSTSLMVTPALLTSITVNPTAVNLPLGATEKFEPWGNYTDDSFVDLTGSPGLIWTSSDPAVATINASGQVTTLALGETNISVRLGSIVSDPVTLTVRAGVLEKLEIIGLPEQVIAGETISLVARGLDPWGNVIEPLTITWSAVGAKVEGASLKDMTKAGEVTVKAFASGKLVTQKLQVVAAAPAQLKLSPEKVTIAQGESRTFTAKVYDAYGNERTDPVAYSSPLGNTGLITANVTPGTYYLTASSGVLLGTAEIQVVSLYEGFRAVVEGGFIKLYAKNAAGVEQLISGYDSISYQIAGQEYGNAVSPDGRFTAGSKEGKYTLTVAIKHGDKTVEKEAEIHVNKGAPQIVVKYRNAELKTGATIIGKPEFTVNLSDGNGIKSVRAYINDREITGFSPLKALSASASSFTTSLSIDDRLDPGNYTLVIEAEDELGTKGVVTVSGLKVYDLLEVQGRPMNYPNPFSSSTGTTLNYQLSKDADVKLMIYDLAGRLVYSEAFTSGSNGGRAGENEVPWTGKSFNGQRLANGVYPFYLTSGGKVIGTGEMAIFE